ncbi:MAG TPA: ribosome silencing factor [Bacillota bacterium]|nr:ribosome silencing factor [Bacillota bacterium]
MSQLEIIQQVATACDDKFAENIVVLDMEGISLIADYFVICHANNERQVQAVARSVRDTFEAENISIELIEGLQDARWVVIDAGNIICHIFHKDEREHYNLERLWGDARRVPIAIRQQ